VNGRIVIDVTSVGEPPDETYRFGIQHPEGVRLDQVASVLNIVVRNIRTGQERLGPDDEAHL
jgi:hypothetical protein